MFSVGFYKTFRLLDNEIVRFTKHLISNFLSLRKGGGGALFLRSLSEQKKAGAVDRPAGLRQKKKMNSKSEVHF